MAHNLARVIAFVAASSMGSTAALATISAVACDGTATSRTIIPGSDETEKRPLGQQIYVIDDDRISATRALAATKQFDPVCPGTSSTSITPDRVRSQSSGPTEGGQTECTFDLDRKAGSGTSFMKLTLSEGGSIQEDWIFDCRKTAVPVFATTKTDL